MQVAKDEVAKIEDIDLILGNNEKKNIVEHLQINQKKNLHCLKKLI